MAYKDEYEVARLYTDGAFRKKLNQQFEGDFTLEFHLAPPLLCRARSATGELRKRAFGPWMLHVLQAAGARCSGCAAPRSISSATPRSAAWSGG